MFPPNKLLQKRPPYPKTLAMWLVIGLSIVGAACRMYYLDRPMRADEARSFLEYAQVSYAHIVTSYDDPNNHIFHTLLMRSAFLSFGNHPWVLRLPVLFSGILIPPLVYALAARLYDRRVGVVAAALTSVSGALIDFSVNARGYTILTCIFVGMCLLAHELLSRPTRSLWAAFFALAVIGFYTLPSMVLPMGIVSLWLLVNLLIAGKWRMLAPFGVVLVLGAIVTLVFYAPTLLGGALDTIFGENGFARAWNNNFLTSLMRLPRRIARFVTQGMLRELKYAFAVLVPLSALIHYWRGRDRFPLYIPTILWSLIVMLVLQTIPPLRTFLFVTPIFLLYVALAIDHLILRYLPGTTGIAVIVILIAIQGWAVLQPEILYKDTAVDYAPDAIETAQYLSSRLAADDKILFLAQTSDALRYHLDYLGTPHPVLMAGKREDFVSGDNLYVVRHTGDQFTAERLGDIYEIDIDGDSLTLSVLETYSTWELLLISIQ